MASSFLFAALKFCFLLISLVHCESDYCAWNRGKAPVSENNAGTYNFLNGEFLRDTSFSSGGQSEVYAGMPYYKMEIANCYLSELWLFRHIDYTDRPAVNHWVIASAVGVTPLSGYAYCGPLSGVTTDPATPSGDCDGNWMVGAAQDLSNGQNAGQELDALFKVMIGGCPQVSYEEIEFVTDSNDFFAGTFTYFQPNIYRQTNSLSQSGFVYLMWQPKVWRWAINEYYEDANGVSLYDECELYKFSKGFTSVANVIDGGYEQSVKAQVFYNDNCETCTRLLVASGSIPTPNPTAAAALIPTNAPSSDLDAACSLGWSKWPPNLIALCGNRTPSPVLIPKFTPAPTPTPTPSPTDPPNNGNTVTTSTTSSGSTARTPTPTIPGTAAPTAPTTAYPTDVNGFRAPTGPTTQPPTSPGKAAPTSASNGNGNGGETKTDDGTIGGLDETVFWILLILILVLICCFLCVCCAYFYNQKRVRGTAAFG